MSSDLADAATGLVASPTDVVLVAVDVPALADQGRAFAYLAPPSLEVGAVVRVPLHGRRVKGWVVARDVEPPDGVRLSRIAKVSGRGPGPDVVSLTAWGAWRWAGRRTALLRAGSAAGVVPAFTFWQTRSSTTTSSGPTKFPAASRERQFTSLDSWAQTRAGTVAKSERKSILRIMARLLLTGISDSCS